MGVFHVFLIVQMAPNRAKHHILEVTFGDNSLDQILNKIVNRIYSLSQKYNLHQHSHCDLHQRSTRVHASTVDVVFNIKDSFAM